MFPLPLTQCVYVAVAFFVFSERRVKFNITWNSNGTVSYRQKRLFHFIPEMSDGNSEEDQFITPNPVYWVSLFWPTGATFVVC